jgi:hypothetical protein
MVPIGELARVTKKDVMVSFNPLNAELNPICHLLALLGAHYTLYVSRIRVKPPYWHLRGETKFYASEDLVENRFGIF